MLDESVKDFVVGPAVCIQVRDESGRFVEDATVDEPADENDVAGVVDASAIAFVACLPAMLWE